ncbi:MAG: hypothetical protein ACXWLM_02250 [Myxococcales bacterium]
MLRILALLLTFGCAAGPIATPDAGEADAGEAPDAAVAPEDAGAPDAGPSLHTGVLLFGEGPIAGLRTVSGSTEGQTDAHGSFRYEDGAQVAFYAGGLLLARVDGAALLTPFALAGRCSVTDKLRSLLALLESLDTDAAAPGVQLPPLDPSLLAGQSLADPAQALAVLAPGATLVDPAAALDDFVRQVDGEEWQETSVDTFSTADSAVRSQGVANDGQSWFFSWRLGLSRTALDYAVEASRTAAIPATLALQDGENHIGDIDVLGQTLYAPFEDGSKYDHPRVAFYDAQSLSFLSSVALDVALQPDGVPWVAVWQGMLVTAPWSPAPELHLWDMTGSFLRAIPLRPAQARLQGLKARGGVAWATRDSDPKAVIKIDLETGTVIELFQIPGIGEIEGLALDAAGLHTLNANPGGTAMEFRHHLRTRAPLREQVCPQ